MKRLTAILVSLLTTFATLCGVYAANAADAYIDEGRLVIKYKTGMSDTAVAAYYSGQTLCGAYFAETDGEIYSFNIPEGYTKIRVWFTGEDEMRSVQIIDRTALAVSPTPTAVPSLSPTAEPTIAPTEEPTEEYEEGYGGFSEQPDSGADAPPDGENVQTFVFSVECHNALSSDSLSDELRGALPADGFIAPAVEYELAEGTSIYDALMAAEDEYGFEVKSKSGYVSAICGLGEFDCGPFSGWMYLVNGKAIMSPTDGYMIAEGDEVRIAYTCSFGRDLGQEEVE